MADISIIYKDNNIAEISGSGSKTLTTSGCYCESDIQVQYKPSFRRYEITLTKSSGWVFLTTLDAETLNHINDPHLIVTLCNVDNYACEFYAGTYYIFSNTPHGYNGQHPSYGITTRESNETACQASHIYYPPNNTDASYELGGHGMPRLDGNKYYFRPGDGFLKGGKWHLTFMW